MLTSMSANDPLRTSGWPMDQAEVARLCHKWEGDACRQLAARCLALADQASGQTPFTRTRLGKRSAGENRYSLAWRGPTGTMIWTYGVPFHIT
jgi:hypothetical protein